MLIQWPLPYPSSLHFNREGHPAGLVHYNGQDLAALSSPGKMNLASETNRTGTEIQKQVLGHQRYHRAAEPVHTPWVCPLDRRPKDIGSINFYPSKLAWTLLS